MLGCGRRRRRRMRNRIKIQIKARRKNNDCAQRGGSECECGVLCSAAAWKFMNTPLSREWIRNQPESRSVGRSAGRQANSSRSLGCVMLRGREFSCRFGKIHAFSRFRVLYPAGGTYTVLVLRMTHRKWRETKQQPIMLPGPAVPGGCLVSFHFLWAILSTSTVYWLQVGSKKLETGLIRLLKCNLS